MQPGPKPTPSTRRNYRATIALPNDLAEHFGLEPKKSRVAEDALRLWYSLSEAQRYAMLAAAQFNSRTTVQ